MFTSLVQQHLLSNSSILSKNQVQKTMLALQPWENSFHSQSVLPLQDRESPAPGVEQATFDLWQNSREFYRKTCGLPIGPTYRLLRRLVSDGHIWCVVEEK
jgi:hypothetical protein